MNFLIICIIAVATICTKGAQVRNHASLGVINGTEVSITNFPYMSSLTVRGLVYGSGVIVHPRWILTTAFIVARWNKTEIEFRVGSSNYKSGGKVLEIEKIIIHENFRPGSWDNDMALVKVKPMKFGRKVKSIALGQKNLPGGTKVVISGWGEKNQTQPSSDVLLAANVTVLDWKVCNETFSPDLTPRMLCTYDKNVGPCGRDFGDPLVINKAVYGLYCGGRHCIPGNNPVLYTNVAALKDWITKTISNNSQDPI